MVEETSCMLADVMTTDVVSVSPDTTLAAVASLMADRRISGVPVVDNGKLVGIVTEADLLDETRRRAALPRIALFGLVTVPEEAVREAFEEGATLTAGQVMTRRVFTLPEETPASTAASEMLRRRINRVPVMRGEEVVGIVTRGDLLRALAGEWRTDTGGSDG